MPALACLLILALVLTDIVSAAFYALFDWGWVGALRLPHEGLAALLFLAAALSPRLPVALRLTGLLYMFFIAIYAVVALAEDSNTQLVLVSAAKLALPAILFGAGFACCHAPRHLRPVVLTLVTLGVATVLFGRWDRGNTEFWTDTLRYGEYLMDIKNVMIGYRGDEFLPFNFFGFENERRAAGLLAAPLAQGSFLATVCLASLGWFRWRNLPLGLLLTLLFLVGILNSGTRGAMLMVAVALPLFLMLTTRSLSGMVANMAMLGAVCLISLGAITTILSYTIGLQDGSTIGHVTALQENLEGLGGIVLAGYGIGSAGANAADLGLDIAGGGEGSFFSIAYQLGLPGGLAFLLFYGAIVVTLARGVRAGTDSREAAMAAAAIAIAIGGASSLVISEHLLTASGMGPFWIFLGAVCGGLSPHIGRRA